MKTAVWIALGSLLFARPAFAQKSQYSDRITKARQAAFDERKRLGLSDEKAARQFPTPEVSFKGEAPSICPGKTGTVRIDGKLAPGTTVVLQSDAVEVTNERFTPSGWQATAKVKDGAPPQQITAQVAAPVSFASRWIRALDVRCAYEWKLELKGGDTLVVKTGAQSDAQQVDALWTKKGGKAITVPFTAQVSDGLSLDRYVSPEEQQAQANGMLTAMESPRMKELDARGEKAMAAIQACTEKATKDLAACMKAPSEEMKKVAEEKQALLKAGASGPTHGCEAVQVSVRDGKVEGNARGCFGHESESSTPVTGTYRPL